MLENPLDIFPSLLVSEEKKEIGYAEGLCSEVFHYDLKYIR